MDVLNFIGLFIFLAGFVIGLGAVTVIDIHGFLGRKIMVSLIISDLGWWGGLLLLVFYLVNQN